MIDIFYILILKDIAFSNFNRNLQVFLELTYLDAIAESLQSLGRPTRCFCCRNQLNISQVGVDVPPTQWW